MKRSISCHQVQNCQTETHQMLLYYVKWKKIARDFGAGEQDISWISIVLGNKHQHRLNENTFGICKYENQI